MERREALENPREGKKRRGNAEGDSSSGPAAPSPSAEQPLFVSGSDRDRGEEGGGMGWNKAQMGGGGEGGVGAGMSSEEWAEASRLLAQTATQIETRVAPKGGRLIWEVLEEEQERWLDEHERHAGVGELLEEAKLAVEIAEASPDVVLPLLRYQKEWLAWALKQEASSYKGGILADEMGMGKTIEAIALVLTARPTGSSAQGTLVICPLVALNQWASEIERHTRKGSVRVLVYHGSKRFKMEREYDFNGYDFVLTTYHTMEGDFRRTLMQPKEKCNWCGKMLAPKMIKIHLMKHCKSFAQRTKKETSMPSLEQAQSSVSNNKTGRRRNSQRGSNDTGKDDEPTDNPEKFTSVLHTVKWERIILDEAHFIKDARSNTARAVFAFQSLYKWALSGTPFQSHIRELYSLVRFLQITPYSFYFCQSCNCKLLDYGAEKCPNCTHWGIRHFCWWTRYITKPVKDRLTVTPGRRAMILLKDRLLKSIVLRRTKKGRVADLALPPRIDALRWDTLDEREQEFYEALYTKNQVEFNIYASSGTILNNYVRIVCLLTRLRQAVDHPYLVLFSKTSDAPCGRKNDASIVCCDICDDPTEDPVVTSCDHSFCRNCLPDCSALTGSVPCPLCSKPFPVDSKSDKFAEKRAKTSIEGFKNSSILNRLNISKFKTSTKIDALQEEIVHMIEGDSCAKGIVFSQFTSFLDLINYSLKMSGIMCVQFVGSMTHIQRENAITLFTENDDCKIFLTSLKAGGVALNLKVASHVFLMEPWWNTAVERQAQDRIHRIGQHKPVRTMKFVIEGTIEERILQMQKKREKVFEGTFGDSTEDMAQLTEADLKFLFRS